MFTLGVHDHPCTSRLRDVREHERESPRGRNKLVGVCHETERVVYLFQRLCAYIKRDIVPGLNQHVPDTVRKLEALSRLFVTQLGKMISTHQVHARSNRIQLVQLCEYLLEPLHGSSMHKGFGTPVK